MNVFLRCALLFPVSHDKYGNCITISSDAHRRQQYDEQYLMAMRYWYRGRAYLTGLESTPPP